MHTVGLRPDRGLESTVNVEINAKQYVEEVLNIDGFLDVLAELQTAVNAKTKSLGKIEEYPKLLMLGTGSSIPNKVRNTSGMLLELDEERSIIFDCGEGTIGQLERFFGESEIDRILKTVKVNIYLEYKFSNYS